MDRYLFHAIGLLERLEVRQAPLTRDLVRGERAPAVSSSRDVCYPPGRFERSCPALCCTAIPKKDGAHHRAGARVVSNILLRHGYVPCGLFRDRLWDDKRVEFWCSQNRIIFCKQEMVRAVIPADVIAADRAPSSHHPLTFVVNGTRYCPLPRSPMGLAMKERGAYLVISTKNPVRLDCRQGAAS